MPDYEYEARAAANGFTAVCGVDEAGRGPLAGPVFAAAVILPDGLEDLGINDSKKLSEKKRDALFDLICEKAIAFSVASADEKEIDELNILNATFLAMRRAVEGLPVKPDYVLVDGNRCPKTGLPEEAVVKGDAKSISIAAASILAKVTRDRMCADMDAQYPQYGFAKHKGYPTKAHMDAVREHGPSPIHRKTFLKFLDEDN